MATLLQRLDAEIAIFTDGFTNLVKAARVDTFNAQKSQVTLSS